MKQLLLNQLHLGGFDENKSSRRARTFRVVPLDPGIAKYVEALQAAGVETFESCQGGEGHSAVEPIVRFFGDKSEGFRALDVALKQGHPVLDLRRYWQVIDGEPCGPYWELAFR